MRVALFTETYVPYINGVVTHVKILKEGLEELGHEVLVVTADDSTRRHYVKNGVLHCPARHFKRFYNYSVSNAISQRRLKFIRDFHPDIIHIHNEFGIGLSGIAAAKILKVPLVYTLHTMYDDYLYYIAPSKMMWLAKKVAHHYIRFLGNSATALTGPSKKCQEYFKMVGVRKDVSVIPNSVELDDFDPDKITTEQRRAFREKYGFSEDVMIACFVGRLGKEKSVDVLLDYWAKTIRPEDRIMLCIIGGGPSSDDLKAQAKELGIESMVVFTGAIPHTEMPPCYASCDVYVTASLSENHSISMLEGMASGLPVLQRYDELNEDQIISGVNGYTYNSPEEMADELRRIRQMSKEELTILKKSVISSVRRSGAEALANYTLNVYQKIIKKP